MQIAPPAQQKAKTAQVRVFGGPSLTSSFGSAGFDTITPTGQTFSCHPADWPFPAGAAPFHPVTLQDGVSIAFGTMSIKNNELLTTSLRQSLCIWNTTTERLQIIDVPTTMGFFSVPHSGNTATGMTLDICKDVAIGGTEYLFCMAPVTYFGWQIAVYGEPYVLMVFKNSSGTWTFDPGHSRTASQLAAGSAAGASAFYTTTNTFGETVYNNPGFGAIGITPATNQIIAGAYNHIPGNLSGCLVAIDPAAGLVTAFTQIPNITDVNSIPLQYSVRDVFINPTSPANDERFVVVPDVFYATSTFTISSTLTNGVSSGTSFTVPALAVPLFPGQKFTVNDGAGHNQTFTITDQNNIGDTTIGVVAQTVTLNTGSGYTATSTGSGYPLHPLTEWSYNQSTNSFTVESLPWVPTTVNANMGYTLSPDLANYDHLGNLWCTSHWGAATGFGGFNSGAMYVFEASGNTLPTMEAGMTGDGFNGGVFPTASQADFAFGNYEDTKAHVSSINEDTARGNQVVVTGLNGKLYTAVLDASPAVGAELCTNTDLSGGTTGYNGFFAATLAKVADGAFTGGQCLEATADTFSVTSVTNGAVVTTLTVTGFPYTKLTAGSSIRVTDGTLTQTFTLALDAFSGQTTLHVNSTTITLATGGPYKGDNTNPSCLIAQSKVSVTGGRCFRFTFQAKVVTAPETVKAQIWWNNAAGTFISASSSDAAVQNDNGVYTIQVLDSAPEAAASAFVLANISATTIGEKNRVANFSWKSMPALAKNTLDTNFGRLSFGASTFGNKATIVGSRLLWTIIHEWGFGYPSAIGASIPQWLVSVDLPSIT